MNSFEARLKFLQAQHEALITRPNEVDSTWSNGVFERYRYPVLTAAHTPLFWRYDLNPQTNPYLMERMGVNGVFNAGAIELNGKICLAARVEGADRKSFFAIKLNAPLTQFLRQGIREGYAFDQSWAALAQALGKPNPQPSPNR